MATLSGQLRARMAPTGVAMMTTISTNTPTTLSTLDVELGDMDQIYSKVAISPEPGEPRSERVRACGEAAVVEAKADAVLQRTRPGASAPGRVPF